MKAINIISLVIFATIELIYMPYYVEPYLLFGFLLYLLIDYTVLPNIFRKKIMLTESQKAIYNNLSYYLTEYDFLMLFNSANMVSTKLGKKLVTTGTDLNKLYYFAVVPNYSNLHIKFDNTIISYIKSNTWIGLLEFILYSHNNTYNKYLIDLCMEHSNNEIIYYEWDINVNINNIVSRQPFRTIEGL